MIDLLPYLQAALNFLSGFTLTQWAVYVAAAIYLPPLLLMCMYAYVMQMSVKRKAGTMTVIDRVFGYPALAIGLPLDYLVNIVHGTIAFVELPQISKLTLTARLKKHNRAGDGKWLKGWRYKAATTILITLAPLDPTGGHNPV